MKKILDIIIIVLLTIIIVNLFSNNDTNKQIEEKILITTSDNSYTIPASVKLKITNNKKQDFKVNTCDNIIISNNAGEKLNFLEKDCETITVKSGEIKEIDYEKYYSKFEIAGNYVIKTNLEDKEYINTFEIENPGTFRKLFTSLFYAPVYNAMVYFIEMFSHSLGWGIILITVIVRIILLWPQHKMMLSQRKLQKVQPKIKQIQEKYKGQQQVLGMKLMELYKKEKVNPMGSCGFLLIQMPILLVIYNVILYIKDESNLYYLYSILDGFDLSKLDSSFFSLELLESGGKAGIILAIVVGLIQYIQIKLSLSKNKKDNNGVVLEKKAKDDKYSNIMPDPEMMNKFMLYGMPAMVVVFTYMLFAGVGLYWGISTLFMIVQQLIVNNISKK